MTIQIANSIDLAKLGEQIKQYEREWIAVSSKSTVVGHGKTYRLALDAAKNSGYNDVVLFKVPLLDYSFAPVM